MDSKNYTVEVEKIIAQMTLKEKVGQVCVPILQSGEITDEMVTAISKMGAGMVRYCPNAAFDNNSEVVGQPNRYFSPSQMADFLNNIQKIAKENTRMQIPLLIAVDQEGSTRSDINRAGANVYPGHMAFGAIDDPELTYRAAKATAREFRAMGINMVQAPIIDVLRYEGRKTMKASSFGESIDLVCKHGLAMLQGFKAGGLSAMAKHFPGYGSIATDAHKGTSEINKTFDELELEDIAPFKTLFEEGVDGIMMGHVITHCLDSLYPATLSKNVIKEYLRKVLKYEGIVETDAMRMKAIQDNYGTAQASIMAVQAGCDLVLLRGDFAHYKEGYDAILDAAQSGIISEEELNESMRRLLSLKYRLGLFDNPYVNAALADEIVGCKEHRAISKEVASRSVSLMKNDGSIPLQLEETKSILALSVEPQKIAAAMDSVQSVDMLLKAIKQCHQNTVGLMMNLKPTKQQIEKALSMAENADIIVVGVCNAILYREQKELVDRLSVTGKPVIVIAMESPYDIEEFPQIKNYICTYGVAHDSIASAAEVVFGKIQAVGIPPIKLGI